MTASARSLATAYGASAPAPDVSLGDDGIERSRDPSANSSPVPISRKSGMSPFLAAQIPGVVELGDLGCEARALLLLDREEDLEELGPERRGQELGFRRQVERLSPRARQYAFPALRITVAFNRWARIDLATHATARCAE